MSETLNFAFLIKPMSYFRACHLCHVVFCLLDKCNASGCVARYKTFLSRDMQYVNAEKHDSKKENRFIYVFWHDVVALHFLAASSKKTDVGIAVRR